METDRYKRKDILFRIIKEGWYERGGSENSDRGISGGGICELEVGGRYRGGGRCETMEERVLVFWNRVFGDRIIFLAERAVSFPRGEEARTSDILRRKRRRGVDGDLGDIKFVIV